MTTPSQQTASIPPPDETQQLLEYRAILENASVAILFTQDRKVLHCNARFAEMFGWSSPEELRGQPGSAFWPTLEDYAEAGRSAGPSLALGKTFDAERLMRRKDGSIFLCHVIAKAVNPAATAEGTIWIGEDVTDRRRAEEAMKRLLLEQQAILENASVGILFTRGGSIQHCNRRMEQMFGWAQHELIGQPAGVFFSGSEEYARFGQAAGPVLSAGNQLDIEWLNVRRDGSTLWCRILARALSASDPTQGTIWVAEDVSSRHAAEAALNQLLLEQQAILDNTLIGIVILRDRIIQRCNRRFEEIFGYTARELDGRPIRLLYPSDESYALGGKPYADLAQGLSHQREQILMRKGGITFWCRIVGRLMDVSHPEKGTVALFDDITERKQAEEQLKQAMIEQELILDNATIGISFNKGRKLVRCNRRLEELLGYGHGELTNRPVRPLFASEQNYLALGAAMQGKEESGENIETELQLCRKNGELFWCRLGGRSLRTTGVQDPMAWIWTYEDVTAHREAQETLRLAHEDLEQRVRMRTAELATANKRLMEEVSERVQAENRVMHLANHDALTGLPNRRLLHDRLSQALALAHREGRHVAVLFMDLDRFKTINDSLGHMIGDALLQGVAGRLLETLREGDTVSRLGGDEFLIVLPNLASPHSAETVAEKVIEALGPPFEVGGHELRITPSIGISLFPEDGDNTEALLRNADSAMYHAKDMGRNNYQFFTTQMNLAAAERLQLENDLHGALARGEFELHYQPRVRVASGTPCGIEALIRWRHPVRGLVPPGQFIPLAEETGLIVPIGEWVIGEACRQGVAWRAAGLPLLPIAVNLSPRQFQQADLIEKVARSLGSSGWPSHLLELEITEGVLMTHTSSTIQTLDKLNELGVRLAIDDFGTGYSSLSYLKRFPVDLLKIDQSFVRDLTVDPDDAAIVTAIIGLAHSLGLTVVAEGVETESQLAFIRDAGCDEAQGYYFSRPLPANELAAKLG